MSIVRALNMLHKAENELKRFELFLESAVNLVKELESEQEISAEEFLRNRLENMHVGDEGTRWTFKEKLALLEAILDVRGKNAAVMPWNQIVLKFKTYANTVRTEDACRSHWQKIG